MVLMSVLKVYDPNLYNEIGSGKSPWEELQVMLRSSLNQADAQWWLLTFLAGSGITNVATNGSVEVFLPGVTVQHRANITKELLTEWKTKQA
jgi:hypothetical protein